MPPTLIVALDVAEPERALVLREVLAGMVDDVKVGSELFTAAGPPVVETLCRSGARVFLDLKFHDIPTTVARAVAAASRLGVSLVDVHASGGLAMMEAAREAARETGNTAVYAVTVLTHLENEELARLGMGSSSEKQAVRLARLAREAGLDGVVASAWEAVAIREATGGEIGIIVPGVRPAWAGQRHDQKRVATPSEAARAGADYVVVGRAITEESDPRAAAERIQDELASA